MLSAAHELRREESVLETDLCIVGAGPAGLVLAAQCAAAGMDTSVLESGGARFEAAVQALNDADTAGTAYGDLRRMRQRQVGGTAAAWNSAVDGEPAAKFLPLDPIDFTERSWVALSGWPITREDLTDHYRRAQALCGLGPWEYQAEAWRSALRAPLDLPGPWLKSGVYQFGTASPFIEDLPRALAEAANVRLLTHATVVELVSDSAAERVRYARVACANGRHLEVRARNFVLAAGAIENARLLLASRAARAEGLGNQYGWVGRCFMEHPRDYALRLLPARRALFDELIFYDQHRAADGTPIAGRLALTEEALRTHRLTNASVTLLPAGPRPRRLTGWRRWIGPFTVRSRPDEHGYPRGGAGWSARPDRCSAWESMRLLINLEQEPHPDNRLVLTDRCDALGLPKIALHWQWRAREQAALQRLRTLISEELQCAGLGRVVQGPVQSPDPCAHHHAGTARMHSDPRYGVVDADCRVHGMENLWVTGSAVFPTAGFANPTLTIVALALRLADRLESEV